MLLTLDGRAASRSRSIKLKQVLQVSAASRYLDCAALVGSGTMADRPDERRL
jgi:hypothetical protein